MTCFIDTRFDSNFMSGSRAGSVIEGLVVALRYAVVREVYMNCFRVFKVPYDKLQVYAA